MSATHPILGCVQLNTQSNIDDNLIIIEAAIVQAQLQGAHIVVLPENACRMGNQHELSQRFDAISQWYSDLAHKHQLFIVAGTLPCAYRPNGTPVADKKLRQVCQIFSPAGKRIARYDKIHLFRARVADKKGSYDEGLTFEPGDTTVVAQCDVGSLGVDKIVGESGMVSIGLMICFDLRFPALAQRLRQAGADLLTAPSAFTYQTGKAHWKTLLQARALDAQCMVIGAAQGGTHRYGDNNARETWGYSAIANANGEIVDHIDSTSVSNLRLDALLSDALLSNTLLSNAEQSTAPLSADPISVEEKSGYGLITCPFDALRQQTWRENLPTHHCHRLG